VVDVSGRYNQEILSDFIDEYRRGRTPNPCLRCNPLLKFGLLPRTLREQGLGFDYFVTGHYARLLAEQGDPGRPVYLAPGRDAAKDQSYFLQRLSPETLAFSRFPLGGMTKAEVRALAREKGLVSADQKDSQDFIAPGDYDILFADPVVPPGPIVSRSGAVLGTHRGLNRYTVGQRRGLGVSVGTDPLYVLALDAERNRVVVGAEQELYSPALEAAEAVWAPGYGDTAFRGWVKIRLASPPAPALVTPLAGGRVRVDFDQAQRAVAPGQSAAFYVPLPGAAGEAPDGALPSLPTAPGRRVPADSLLAGGAIIDRALR
jgi:tRNA-specific 2-thiouridylase